MPESLPSIPSPQQVTVPAQPTNITLGLPFQPVTTQQFLDFNNQLFNQQQSQANSIYASAYQGIEKYGADWINQALRLDTEFMPQYAQLYTSLLDQANPQFNPIYNELGSQVMQDLQSGYQLGPGLTHEMEQSMRAAQTARGNWLGTAPTAQEVFGMGQAALGLHNQRMGIAQNFLNSKQPSDMWSQMQSASKYGIWDAGTVGQAVANQYNPAIAPNVFGTVAGSQSNYNQTAASTQASLYGSYTQGLIGAANVNNEAAFSQYQAQLDQFLYRQAVNNGLYSTPQIPGASGSSMMGGIGSALGGVGAGLTGLAASGVIGAGATAGAAGIAGAAAGAAAAICWLARKLIPGKWKSFRKYIFTLASDEERRDYLYNSRRLANALA